jgi:hypothetical protein
VESIDPPLSGADKAAVRAVVFHHLAGIALAPTVNALRNRAVFELLEESADGCTLGDVVARTHGNRGYLGIALRLLVSYGWLRQSLGDDEPRYALTARGRIAVRHAALYADVVSFIPKAIFLDDFLFGSLGEVVLPSLRGLVVRSEERWGLSGSHASEQAEVELQITRHLDGLLVGPVMVALAREGIFAQIRAAHGGLSIKSMRGNRQSLRAAFDLLVIQGWLEIDQDRVSLTRTGAYAADIATAYGVTVSYLPLFEVLSTLLFGNPRLPRVDETGTELLVNRGMNVWGSGGAHRTYFKKCDEIIIEIFSRPIDEQPAGICDMGCGDGTLLEHLYTVVRDKTPRGKMLDTHPLLVIGSDYNKAARRVAKQRLRRAKIPNASVIRGDINRPAQLASELEKLDVDVHDLLHVRSFLDHNRPYLPPAKYERGSREGRSTGRFALLGEEIPNDELEENLVRHLRRWAPYVGRFGLLVMELHTIEPERAAENVDTTLAIAYDGTHGYSDQYLVEHDAFLDCVREAGLVPHPRCSAKYPPTDLATVSINLFVTSGA